MFCKIEKGKLEKANDPNLYIPNTLLDRFHVELTMDMYIVHRNIFIFFSYNGIYQISKEGKLLTGKNPEKPRNTKLPTLTSWE